MWQHVGIIRTQDGLRAAAAKIRDLEKAMQKGFYNNIATCELKNMLQAGLLITEAAVSRRKSLGCHYIHN
jgi:L-aspartate oxidase